MAGKSSPKVDSTTLDRLLQASELEKDEDIGPATTATLNPPEYPRILAALGALRCEIASELVATGKSAYTFSSPFELPPGAFKPSRSSHPDERIFNRKRLLEVPLVYCDQTASNRTVQSIEDYMIDKCLPLYGNTHTSTSITGAQSMAFVAEARQIVAEEANARITGKAGGDLVLFTGSGSTSAVQLLIDCLGLRDAATAYGRTKPVVFVGPHEHHSNILPWREAGCETVMVPECPQSGSINFAALESLARHSSFRNRLRMGTFSAASNVNGKVADVDRIAATLHKFGALAFFDYATGAPYMTINMNPPPSEKYANASLVAKDAIFLSPHKMLGGVGTPGVLLVKKRLVNQEIGPSRSGGGTVFYVSNSHHRFLSNRIDRFEGGTPDVPGILRVGLTFLLKRQAEQKYRQILRGKLKHITDAAWKCSAKEGQQLPANMLSYELQTYDRATHYWRLHAPNVIMLGGRQEVSAHNLPILSFLIKCGKRFLHYNYVCAILNDVFGIQSRGGCQCSGPYSQRLLGLTEKTADGKEVPNDRNQAIEYALLQRKEYAELLRPGYTRLSLPFKGLRCEEAEYVINAVVWTAKNGWALMCNYRCNHRTGEWRHASRQGTSLGRTERKWLNEYDMFVNHTNNPWKTRDRDEMPLSHALANADLILDGARTDRRSIVQAAKMNELDVTVDVEKLRWYVHPKECAVYLSQGLQQVPGTESSEIVGGLEPLGLHLRGFGEYRLSTSERTADDVSCDEATLRERRGEQEQEQAPAILGKDPTVRDKTLTSACRSVREPQLADIKVGFEKDELVETCEVFDQQTGEWLLSNSSGCPTKSRGRILVNRKNAEALLREGTNQDGDRGASAAHEPARGRATGEQRTRWRSRASLSAHGPARTKGACQPPCLTHENKVTANPKIERRRTHMKPPVKLMRHITQAVVQWNMLEEGDRLLLGLSGGKDSLSLLHCLLECEKKLPIKFHVEVCTIDPMTPSFDPSPLIPYVRSLGVKYHYIQDNIVSRANRAGKDGKPVSSLCSFCARLKRGSLYTCARRNNCNKLVLAQHLDDCAESFLMSVLHNGQIRTMKAHYTTDSGDLVVIRPMVYCRESLMTKFAKSANLPVINENCPACFEEPKERARTKKILSMEESLYPQLFDSLRRSLIPLMHNDLSSIMRGYADEAIARQGLHKTRRIMVRKVDALKSVTAETRREVLGTAKRFGGVAITHELVSSAYENNLLVELGRRRAKRFRRVPITQVIRPKGGWEQDALKKVYPEQLISFTGS